MVGDNLELSVILKLNGIIIGDSSSQELSPDMFYNADEMIVKRGEEEWMYSPVINQDGGFSSTNGNQDLTRSTVMNLVGGQNNYNWMLSQEGKTLPSTIISSQDSGVLINGEEMAPNFYVYPDGEIYLDGYNTPLTMEQIKQYFPNLYASLVGGSGSTTQEDGKEHQGSSSSGRGSSSQRGSSSRTGSSSGAKPSQTSQSSVSDSAVETAKEAVMSPSSSTVASTTDIIQIDYSNLESMASSLNQSLSKLKGITGDYQSVVQEIAGSSNWIGEERDRFANLSDKEYAQYMKAVCEEAETLYNNIQKCMRAFQEAEDKIMSLTL